MVHPFAEPAHQPTDSIWLILAERPAIRSFDGARLTPGHKESPPAKAGGVVVTLDL
jgi:hypothetical protein